MKLTYFGLGIRAEPMRMALWHGKMEYEDERLTFEEFGARKASLPGGQLPFMEHEGKVMNESMAMFRYIGKKTGLYPEDNYEAWSFDQVVDFLNDYMTKIC